MQSYHLLNSQNELSHINQLLLEASGTLCLLFLYNDLQAAIGVRSELTHFTENHSKAFLTCDMPTLSAEVLHRLLLKESDEKIDGVFLFYHTEERLTSAPFFGQSYTILAEQQLLEILGAETVFDLSLIEGKEKWEVWLLENLTSHQIEYYDPETNQ